MTNPELDALSSNEAMIFKAGVSWGKFVSRMQSPSHAEEAREAILRLIELMDDQPTPRSGVSSLRTRYVLAEGKISEED